MEKSYINDHLIFETVTGSRSYGTHKEDSDYDKCGLIIPDISYFYGWKKFENYCVHEPEDRTIYDIRKALMLFRENNPNMLDLLWAPDRCVQKSTPYWEMIQSQRDMFLSKRCRHTYSGYAHAQLKRIKIHRKFLINPVESKPERSDYGLPDEPMFPTSQLKSVLYAVIEILPEDEKQNFLSELDIIYGDYIIPLLRRYINSEEHDVAMEWLQFGIKRQAKCFLSLGPKYIKEEYIEMAKSELKYYNDLQRWKQYHYWKKTRNKDRAKNEEKFKYDVKHASHLVRLQRMGKEILSTGQVNVDRTNIDAEELKEIRRGKWTFEEIEEYSDKMEKELDKEYRKSTLPYFPNEKKIQNLCIDVVDRYFRDNNRKNSIT